MRGKLCQHIGMHFMNPMPIGNKAARALHEGEGRLERRVRRKADDLMNRDLSHTGSRMVAFRGQARGGGHRYRSPRLSNRRSGMTAPSFRGNGR